MVVVARVPACKDLTCLPARVVVEGSPAAISIAGDYCCCRLAGARCSRSLLLYGCRAPLPVAGSPAPIVVAILVAHGVVASSTCFRRLAGSCCSCQLAGSPCCRWPTGLCCSLLLRSWCCVSRVYQPSSIAHAWRVQIAWTAHNTLRHGEHHILHSRSYRVPLRVPEAALVHILCRWRYGIAAPLQFEISNFNFKSTKFTTLIIYDIENSVICNLYFLS